MQATATAVTDLPLGEGSFYNNVYSHMDEDSFVGSAAERKTCGLVFGFPAGPCFLCVSLLQAGKFLGRETSHFDPSFLDEEEGTISAEAYGSSCCPSVRM